ncbi:M48 family metalloprotease [Streptomyces avermitilis]|uniref:M48 family metalloprotease n=1 Tax=Streptomyces avermitilis TaxID=33903 RepID=UPI0033BCCE81
MKPHRTGAGVRAGARAGTASALPHPTSTQFLLLLVVLGSASLFAGTWWGVLTQDGWRPRSEACLRRASVAGAAPFSTTRCLNELLLRESAVSLLAPVAVFAVVGAAVLTTTLWRLRRWHRHPLRAGEKVTEALHGCLDESGFPADGRPLLVVERRGRIGGVREEAMAYGLFGRRYIVVANHTALATGVEWDTPEGRIALATLRHEIAHLRAGDVGRTRFAFHALWVFPCLVVLPLAAAALARLDSLGVSLGWRLAVIVGVVLLSFLTFVRTREYEADATAAACRTDPGAMALAVEASLAREPSRWPEPLGLHPDDRSRLTALRAPETLYRLPLASCLIVGTAVGAAFHEVAQLLEAAIPENVRLAYWLTGLLAGTGVTAVVAVSVWRDLDQRARRGIPGLPPAAVPGTLLGLALVAGSQVSPHAAATWERIFPTALVNGDNSSLLSADPAATLPLVALVAAGGAVFVGWARALGPPRCSSALQVAALIGLGGLVLSAPLGLWFAVQRLIATPDMSSSSVEGLLRDPAVLWSLGGTGAVALLTLGVATARPGHRRAEGAGRRRAVPAALGAALSLLVALAVGTGADRRAGPGPPLAGLPTAGDRARPTPERSVPLTLPTGSSATDAAVDPEVDPANACWLFNNTPADRIRSREGFTEVLERIKITRDAGLRAIIRRTLQKLTEAQRQPAEFDLPGAVREIHSACKVVLTRNTQDQEKQRDR